MAILVPGGGRPEAVHGSGGGKCYRRWQLCVVRTRPTRCPRPAKSNTWNIDMLMAGEDLH